MSRVILGVSTVGILTKKHGHPPRIGARIPQRNHRRIHKGESSPNLDALAGLRPLSGKAP